MENPIIEVTNLRYTVNGATVLEDITFQVNSGEYLGIIGPNGGGKTTLLKLMLGLIKPNHGTIKIMGHNIHTLKNRSLIGYVPQRAAQVEFSFPATVTEVVQSGRTARLGVLKNLAAADHQAIDKAMEIADVSKIKSKLIQNLSGGERQRVFIARALAGEPKVIFLDEPTSGVDVSSQDKFYKFLASLNKDLGLTVVFVSHDLDAVANEVSSVLCLNKRLVCHGPPRDYIKEEFLKKLYGSDIKLILHGSGAHSHGHGADVAGSGHSHNHH